MAESRRKRALYETGKDPLAVPKGMIALSRDNPSPALLQKVFDHAWEMIPAGWTLEVLSGQGDKFLCGTWESPPYMTTPDMRIRVPAPESVPCLVIGLHEFGHVLSGHPWVHVGNAEDRELAASAWALSRLISAGIKVPMDMPPVLRFLATMARIIEDGIADHTIGRAKAQRFAVDYARGRYCQ